MRLKHVVLPFFLLLASAFARADGLQTTTFTKIGQGVTFSLVGTGVQYHHLTWTKTGTVTVCSVRVDSSADGITWNVGDIIAAQNCASSGQSTTVNFVAAYARVNMLSFTGTGSIAIAYNVYVNNPVTVASIYASGGVTANTIPKSNGAGLLVDSILCDQGNSSNAEIFYSNGGCIEGDVSLQYDSGFKNIELAGAFKGSSFTGVPLTPSPAPLLNIVGGAAGAYTYGVCSLDNNGQCAPSATAATAVGPTTLDGSHYVGVSAWTNSGAASCDIYRIAGGATQGKIGNVSCGSQLTDNGLVGGGETFPAANHTGSASFANSTNTQVLFNDGGVVAGDAGLTWDKTVPLFTVVGPTPTLTTLANFGPTSTGSAVSCGLGVGFVQICTLNSNGLSALSIQVEDSTPNGGPSAINVDVAATNASGNSNVAGFPFVTQGTTAGGTSSTVNGIENIVVAGNGAATELGGDKVTIQSVGGTTLIDVAYGWQLNNGIAATKVANLYGIDLPAMGGIATTLMSAVHVADQGTGANDKAISVDGGQSVIPSIATGNSANRDLAGQLTLNAGTKTQASTYLYVSPRICVCSSTAATPLAAQVTNAVAATGAIKASVLNAAGTGYAVGDVGTIDGGTGGTYRVLTIGGGGAVATYTITAPGTAGYSVAAAVTTTAVPAGGTGFKIDITVIAGIDTLTLTVPGGVNADTYNYICVGRD